MLSAAFRSLNNTGFYLYFKSLSDVRNFTLFGALGHGPHSHSVRLRTPVTGFTLGLRYRSVGYTLIGRDFHPLGNNNKFQGLRPFPIFRIYPDTIRVKASVA